MNQYVNALIYIVIGFVGAVGHYFKKRYVDNTTNQGFVSYLSDHKQSTVNAIGAIVMAEYGLSMTDDTVFLSLKEFVGALTAGYVADSGINKSQSKKVSQ